MAAFDLPGMLRRIRRRADLSQRELAGVLDVSQSAVAHAEDRRRDLPSGVLARAAAAAGLRLVLLDESGQVVEPMAENTVRDRIRRRFPAHLDPVRTDGRPGHWAHRYDRPAPWHSYGRDRAVRDAARRRGGVADDHPVPRPDDDPEVRRSALRQDRGRRQHEEFRRRWAAGDVEWPPEFECACPPACEALEEWTRPVHVDACPCLCDVD